MVALWSIRLVSANTATFSPRKDLVKSTRLTGWFMHRWLYAASVGERFDPGRVERYDHETAYENLVNAEAAKFEEERTPSSAELERTSEGVRGMCVVSIVVCLEGDETELFADAAASEPRLRTALRDLATRCGVQGGDLVYNAEVLWTPSSADEALFKDEMLVDFPELLAL